MARPPIITLTTDFGLQDHFVGTMKGVILENAPDARLVDISHSVQPFDVGEAVPRHIPTFPTARCTWS